MKAYIGRMANDPDDSACLAFAHDVHEAKKLIWPILCAWADPEYTDMRVRWLHNASYLFDAEADHGKLARDEAHVIEAPTVCRACEAWGDELNADGLCDSCADEYSED